MMRIHRHKNRMWLYMADNDNLYLEWHFFKAARHCLALIRHDGLEGQVTLSIGFPWLFYFAFGWHCWKRFGAHYGDHDQHTTGIKVYKFGIYFLVAADEDESPLRWGWELKLHPKRFLLGRSEYSKRHIETIERVPVHLPEGIYLATVELFESSWKRPRWPFTKRILRADIEVDGGIAIPGKGENSWDIGDDAVFSQICPAKTAGEAAKSLADSVMRTRQRYGKGYAWRPAAPNSWARPSYWNDRNFWMRGEL